MVSAGPEADVAVDVDDVLMMLDEPAAEAVAVVAEFEPGLTLLLTRSPISPLGDEADDVLPCCCCSRCLPNPVAVTVIFLTNLLPSSPMSTVISSTVKLFFLNQLKTTF